MIKGALHVRYRYGMFSKQFPLLSACRTFDDEFVRNVPIEPIDNVEIENAIPQNEGQASPQRSLAPEQRMPERTHSSPDVIR